MIKDEKYCQICVSDKFIIYTKREEGLFGSIVRVRGLPNQGAFEKFGGLPKEQKYKFKSGVMADVFFETVNSVMDYQDELRNCIAPIDYATAQKNDPNETWVRNSIFIGPYQIRKARGRLAQYDKNAELKRLSDLYKSVPYGPDLTYVILDTAQINKNGLFYVYNLLVKTEDITTGYNPNGLATVEITSFVSEDDAECYSQASELFKKIAKNPCIQDKYASVNEKRQDMFSKITSKIQGNEK